MMTKKVLLLLVLGHLTATALAAAQKATAGEGKRPLIKRCAELSRCTARDIAHFLRQHHNQG